MLFPVIALFVVFCISFLSNRQERQSYPSGVFVLIWGGAILIATFRPSEMPDYENYYNAFRYDTADRFELAVSWIISFTHQFTRNPLVLFCLFAMISIALKVGAIAKLSPFCGGSMLIYFANIFILHDMIQLRCAVASGLLLWAVKFIQERSFLNFYVTAIVALLFHNSAIVIFPLYFMSVQKCNRLWFFVIPIAYLLSCVFHLQFGYMAESIPWENFQRLWTMYKDTLEDEEAVNPFNVLQLLRCSICLCLVWNVDKLFKYNRLIIVLTKIYTISLSSLILFADVAVIAFRVSEILLVVEILLIPMIVYLFPKKAVVGKYCVITIGLILLSINVFYIGLLK